MKVWNELDGSKLFNIVFSDPVEIGEIELFSLTLENDQPKLVLQFDIPEIPDKPPSKWGNFNRCRLGIYCLSIRNLKLSNIPCKENLSMKISYMNELFTINASNADASIEFEAGFISLSGPSVYLCETEFKSTNIKDKK